MNHLSTSVAIAVCLAGGVWAQDDPMPERTGQYAVRFTDRDPRSSVQEANLRFGRADRFSAAAHALDLSAESYSVYVPKAYGGAEPYGLLVWINSGNSGQIPAGYKALMDKHRLIWVGANRSGNDRKPYWIRSMMAIDAAFNMKKLYRIDPQRVYVSGPSGGGRMSSMVAPAYPDVFAGGYYVIGCNYMKSVKVEGNKYLPGFWPRINKSRLEAAKSLRVAMITGSTDYNKLNTQRVLKGYQADAFPHVTYLEEPGLGHQIPSPDWYEKGIVALDQPLVDAAAAAFETGTAAERRGEILKAYRGYRQAATHGHGQPFHAQAKAKAGELRPAMNQLSQKKLAELGDQPSGAALRRFAVEWAGFRGGDAARVKANDAAFAELAKLQAKNSKVRRSSVKKFLVDWAGYAAHRDAMAILDSDAQASLDATIKLTNRRVRIGKLKVFGERWAPSKVVLMAQQELENHALSELEEIKKITSKTTRTRKLVALIKAFPGTKAHKQAYEIIKADQGK